MQSVTRVRRRAGLKRFLAIAAATAAPLAAAWTHPAHAATLTWDANPTNPTAPNDGSGNWNTTTDANWSNGATDSFWVNGETAIIGNGGAAGTITIDDPSGTVSAAGINFNAVGSGNYTIAASGANTLTLSGPGVINVASGLGPTISAPIAGSAGMTVNGPGTLNLAGNNTFTGTAAINSGAGVVGAGGTLGSSANAVSLGTVNSGSGSGDPVGALTVATGAATTIGSFLCATNNTAAANTLSIASGTTLNVTSNSPLSGLNSSVNGVFVVGTPNVLGAMTTSLTVSGAGTLNVNGGSNNASFLAAVGNCNSSANDGLVTLNMSGLANFSFVTGSGAIPAGGGNEFAVGHGQGAGATVSLATSSSITAGTISVGDGSLTPGLSGGGPNAPANVSTLNLGSGSNTLNANTILIGNHRSRGIVQWTAGTGSLTIAGAAGGTSTANFTIGRCSSGTASNTASNLNLNGHNVTVQAGTVQLGVLDGGGGSGANKGGVINFDTGTFNIADLKMAVGISGAATGNINGTFNLGNNANSTGVLNVTNSFWIGDVVGGSARAQGSLVIKGGTANIGCNIIDVSTAASSNNALSLTGGTLNMQGFAIGTTAAGTGGLRTIANIVFPTPATSAVLMNLGGNGINNAGLTMNGTGTLILTGTNTYTGGTTVTSGMLQVGQASDAAPLTNPLGAPAVAVSNNATLSFGSSQAVTVPNVIGGSGTVAQTGSGTTTLNTANTYTGPTALGGGVLAASNITDGGAPSSIGASTNAASNLVLTGGTLQYTGGGVSTNRLFSVSPNGGALDASGGGAIVFNNAGAIISADPAARATTTSTTSTRVPLPSVLDLSVGMTVTGANIPAGTTVASINRTTNSITLSNTPTIAGADTFNFSTTARTLTLTGSNTAANTINGVLSDSAGGGAMSVAKSGGGTWNLAGANTYTGSTTVGDGKLVLQNNLTTTSSVAVSGGTLQLAPATTRVLKTPSVSITGTGRLDLSDNKLITATLPGTTTNFIYNGLQGDVQRAYNFQSWDQPGLTTSQPAAQTGLTTIGITTGAARGGLGPTDTDLFQGQTITGASTLAMYTYAGDANLDGLIDGGDYGIIDNNVQIPGADSYYNGDFNYDGVIDGGDYGIIDNNIQQQGAPFPVSGAVSLSGVTAVPEPSACGFAILMGAGLFGRRRRRARLHSS